MEVAAIKENLQVEELRAGSSVSESSIQKVAGSVNFWNKNFESARLFAFNGPYFQQGSSQIGVDGSFGFFTNTELYAIHLYNLKAGTSGNIQVDIIKHFANGSPSQSIFTTKPQISYLDGDNAYIMFNVRDNVSLHSETYATNPVTAIKTFSAGDMITCNITGVQQGGQSAGICLYFAPIN